VATVSPNLVSKLVMDFLVEPQNLCGGGFSGLGLKTGSYGLMILTDESMRWAASDPVTLTLSFLLYYGLGVV
jgi:hypothetical protein